MTSIKLLRLNNTVEPYEMNRCEPVKVPSQPRFSRIAYAAAHVVANPFVPSGTDIMKAIDWDRTIEFRRYLWSLGFGVAEAMDTAQRGAGLDWAGAAELIRLSCAAKSDIRNSKIICGVNTDTLENGRVHTLDNIVKAYVNQIEWVEKCGGQAVIMASRHLAMTANMPSDYSYVYERVIGTSSSPVILHWLGEVFDPKLAGYWGAKDPCEAMKYCLDIIGQGKNVEGIKISLLDDVLEIEMRNKLPENVRMYTGDDFNYAELIKGDDLSYSHALLGIFDPIAPVASAALVALAEGRVQDYDRLMKPTVSLSRKIFEAPTYDYKTGVVFLAYLNGHQDHFRMISGRETGRSLAHLCSVFKAADHAGIFRNPDIAACRMAKFLSMNGID